MNKNDTDTVPTPNGGRARRCQATSKRTGERCKRFAVRGYNVCSTHGAGSPKRVKEGKRKSAGRPPIHGVYSVLNITHFDELQAKVLEHQTDIDNTDNEMTVIRAALLGMVNMQPKVQHLHNTLDKAIKDNAIEDYELQIDAAKAVFRLEGYLERLQRASMEVVKASKYRAETAAKTAEAKATEQYVSLLEGTKEILMDMLGVQGYRTFHQRMSRELLVPKGVKIDEPEE